VKALVVDDSRAMRMIVRRLLQGLGFEVLEAQDGKVALEVLRSQGPFEVALVDWNMPVMNGLELVVAVRADPTLEGLRIMMVTTESSTEHLAAALEAGASEYLMKPFTSESVAEKLQLLGVSVAA